MRIIAKRCDGLVFNDVIRQVTVCTNGLIDNLEDEKCYVGDIFNDPLTVKKSYIKVGLQIK